MRRAWTTEELDAAEHHVKDLTYATAFFYLTEFMGFGFFAASIWLDSIAERNPTSRLASHIRTMGQQRH
jgi:hypothetical protein